MKECKHKWKNYSCDGIVCEECKAGISVEYLEAQEDKVEKLKSMLEKASDMCDSCPFCMSFDPTKHDDDCELMEALKG